MKKGIIIKNDLLIKRKSLQIALGASKVLKKKAYHQATVREIAEASGLTPGNLYDYVKKKEDILLIVFKEFNDLWRNAFDKQEIFSIDDPVKQLRIATKTMCNMASEMRDMTLLFYRDSKSLSKQSLKLILSSESELIKDFIRILENGKQKKLFTTRNVELLGNLIVYLFSFYALRSWNFRDKVSSNEVSDFIVDIVLQLVGIDSEAKKTKNRQTVLQ
jgi:AcrR family transcriptional regulator